MAIQIGAALSSLSTGIGLIWAIYPIQNGERQLLNKHKNMRHPESHK